MSRATFEIEKILLEKELKKYSSFLDSSLKEYEVPYPNKDHMNAFVDRIKSKISEDVGKTAEEMFMYIVVPHWKVMFDGDNFIDTDKTLDEQKEILGTLIQSIKNTGFIENFIDEESTEILNKHFLSDDYKRHILLAILQSEYNLCNEDIHWKDALLERIRIMFYSGLFIGDIDKVDDIIDMVNNKTIKSILPKNVITLLKALEITTTFNETFTFIDLLHYLIFISIGSGVSDDYMDLEEDIDNNKITGITQCVKHHIPIKHILSSTIEYLKQIITPYEYTEKAKKWFVDLMSLMYLDLNDCLAFCKSISPYGYKIVFQRKK